MVRKKRRQRRRKIPTPIEWYQKEENEPREGKWVQQVEGGEQSGRVMGLSFQVADVKKPLVAVKRITEKGNHVSFGPDPGDNFIHNKKSGDKMMLKSNGKGSYLMEVCFVRKPKSQLIVGLRQMCARGSGGRNCSGQRRQQPG